MDSASIKVNIKYLYLINIYKMFVYFKYFEGNRNEVDYEIQYKYYKMSHCSQSTRKLI